MDLPDFTPYTVQDLEDLIAAASRAMRDKKTVLSAAEKIDAIIAEVRQAKGFKDGDPWVQPTGAQDSYPAGAKVTHLGKVWLNTKPANLGAPGAAGWREFNEVVGLRPWKQPTNSENVYNIGDKVLYIGKTWQSTTAANVWEPGLEGWIQL